MIISNQMTLARFKPVFCVGTKNYYLKRSRTILHPPISIIFHRTTSIRIFWSTIHNRRLSQMKGILLTIYLVQNIRITASLILLTFL